MSSVHIFFSFPHTVYVYFTNAHTVNFFWAIVKANTHISEDE